MSAELQNNVDAAVSAAKDSGDLQSMPYQSLKMRKTYFRGIVYTSISAFVVMLLTISVIINLSNHQSNVFSSKKFYSTRRNVDKQRQKTAMIPNMGNSAFTADSYNIYSQELDHESHLSNFGVLDPANAPTNAPNEENPTNAPNEGSPTNAPNEENPTNAPNENNPTDAPIEQP